MVVAGEDKSSSTMLWVQASVVTLEQLHQKSVPADKSDWFYIPRPCLSLPANSNTTDHGRLSESISSGRRASRENRKSARPSVTSLNPTIPIVHGASNNRVSSSSSASSQLSGSSGQPLVDTRPSWLPAHPPPLKVGTKDGIVKKDPELGALQRSSGDGDNVSLASSTHFTIVGNGGVSRSRGGCCSHSHRVTALVLTMSLIFLAGIMTAVVLLEMRIQHRR